jgi:hypothetical protein
MAEFEDELRETVRSGDRHQDSLNPQKYRCIRVTPVERLEEELFVRSESAILVFINRAHTVIPPHPQPARPKGSK